MVPEVESTLAISEPWMSGTRIARVPLALTRFSTSSMPAPWV